MKRILIFGAGAVGRGLLAPIFARAGHRVCFIEENPEIFLHLRINRSYWMNIDGEIQAIAPVTCVDAEVYTDIEREICKADLVFTSVRQENLRKVALTLRDLLVSRADKPLKIIAVENMPDAARQLQTMVGLDQEGIIFCQGIANCIVPETPPELRELNPGLVFGDRNGYLVLPNVVCGEWMPDGIAFLNEHQFQLEWDEKWLLHCAFHLIVGLLGMKFRKEFVYQVFADKNLYPMLCELELAIAEKLFERAPDDVAEIRDRAEREIGMMRTKTAMPDTCARLIRDLRRKMQPGERMDALQQLIGSNAMLDEAIQFANELLRAEPCH